MTRRIHWGITALIILVIAAGGFMYWQWSEVQQLKEQLAQYEKMLEDKKKQVAEVNRKPPGASPNGHWHDGEWHDEPYQPVEIEKKSHNLTQSEIDALNQKLKREGLIEENLSERELAYLGSIGVNWDLLTPEQQAKYDRDYYEQYGLDPPPLGYRYLLIAPGKPRLDESGNPIVIKEGDVYVTVRYGNGFAPTPEQYERYELLEKELIKADNPDKVLEITNEIDSIKQSSQGKIPIGATAVGGGGLSEYQRQLKIKEAFNNAYRDLNLSHLISTD